MSMKKRVMTASNAPSSLNSSRKSPGTKLRLTSFRGTMSGKETVRRRFWAERWWEKEWR